MMYHHDALTFYAGFGMHRPNTAAVGSVLLRVMRHRCFSPRLVRRAAFYILVSSHVVAVCNDFEGDLDNAETGH